MRLPAEFLAELTPWGHGTPAENDLLLFGLAGALPALVAAALALVAWRGRAGDAVERADAQHARRWLRIVAGATLMAHALALPWYASRLAGEAAEATVVARRHQPPARKTMEAFWVSYRLPSGRVVEDQVTGAQHALLPEGTRVPVRVGPLHTTLGPHVTSSGGASLVGAGLVLVAIGGAVWLALWPALRRRGRATPP